MAIANGSGLSRTAEESANAFLHVDQIDPSPQNLRREFSEEELVRLATLIEEVGLLAPIIVRPIGDRFEIVAGERRWRAVKLLGLQEIAATVRELDDREATEVGLLENLDRIDLNPLERAAGFEMLISLGHTAESIAELCTVAAMNVENSVALLSLPEEWQDRVRDGRLSQAAAEYLLPWKSFPAILRFLEPTAEKWPMPLTSWGAKITEIVMNNSRPMDPDDPDGPRFDATGEIRDELQAVAVRVSTRLTLPRAMNVARWDELQAEALDAPKRPQQVVTETSGGNGKPAADKSGRKEAVTGANLAPSDKPMLSAPSEEEITAWRWNWLANLIGDRLGDFNASGLERLAVQLGIDPDAELRATAVEMGIDPVTLDDDADLLEILVSVSAL